MKYQWAPGGAVKKVQPCCIVSNDSTRSACNLQRFLSWSLCVSACSAALVSFREEQVSQKKAKAFPSKPSILYHMESIDNTHATIDALMTSCEQEDSVLKRNHQEKCHPRLLLLIPLEKKDISGSSSFAFHPSPYSNFYQNGAAQGKVKERPCDPISLPLINEACTSGKRK